MRSSHLLVLVLTFCSTAAPRAQQVMVVPNGAAAVDGTTRGQLAGLEERFRQQFLFGDGLLQGLRRSQILSLAFRRDGHLRHQPGVTVQLQVALSTSTRDVAAAASVFAVNRGAVSVVYSGTLNVATSPRLSHRDAATWSTPDAITLPFLAPYVYQNGTLCIDIDGEPVGAPSPWWPIDYETDSVTGIATRLGQACGVVANHASSSGMVDARTLRPGATASLVGVGAANSPNVLLLGTTQFNPPIDLTFLGAAGCWLHLTPDITIPGSIGPSFGARPIGLRVTALEVPAGPAALGACLYAQGAGVEATGLTTTAGLKLQLATNPTRLNAVAIRSRSVASGTLPVDGVVEPWRMPVVRFSYR